MRKCFNEGTTRNSLNTIQILSCSQWLTPALQVRIGQYLYMNSHPNARHSQFYYDTTGILFFIVLQTLMPITVAQMYKINLL